jgi:ABC-type branched-subunit amino acid transport system permease subunit
LLLRGTVACLVAVAVGFGALRVKGLLLGVSTLAFAIAGRPISSRPIFTGALDVTTVQLPRGNLGPIDLAHLNRSYYYFTLAALVIVLLVVGHLRRTGIGRRIIGVRENEPAASALTVSPRRAKLTAFAVAGFVAGLGGAILGGLVVTIGFQERSSGSSSLLLVAVAVIGGLGASPAVVGAVWVVGLPAFWPDNPDRPAVHVEHRAPHHLVVHPGRLHPDRLHRCRSGILNCSSNERLPEPYRDPDRAAPYRSRATTSRR